MIEAGGIIVVNAVEVGSVVEAGGIIAANAVEIDVADDRFAQVMAVCSRSDASATRVPAGPRSVTAKIAYYDRLGTRRRLALANGRGYFLVDDDPAIRGAIEAAATITVEENADGTARAVHR